MTDREPTPRPTRRLPSILLAGLLVAVAATAGWLGFPLLPSAAPPPVPSPRPASSSQGFAARTAHLRSEPPGELEQGNGTVPGGEMVRRPEHRGALGTADGTLPDGATVSAVDLPGVANLDPDLRDALRKAAIAATGGGVEIFVTSGWRSRTYQEQLFGQAVSRYGSPETAARWVAPPGTSAHETGDAVDIGHADATAWLSEHGARYGLCQIYRNEPWHYELRPTAVDGGCPPMYADPTHDPRMRH